MPDPEDLILPPGANGQPPTEGAALLGQDVLEAKYQAAAKMGIYCSSCQQPMDEDGWEYFSVRTDVREGVPVVVSGIAYICQRDCCTEARATLERSAAARRRWPGWHIFYVEPPDVPPPTSEAPAAEQS